MQIVNFEGDVKEHTKGGGRLADGKILSGESPHEELSLILFSTTTTQTPSGNDNPSLSGMHAPAQKQVILVAEDDEINFFYLSVILRHPGIEVVHARDGEEAVKIFRELPETTLVLMDLKMPRMNGFEATALIKQINQDIPVIAVTSYADSQSRQMALEAGCDDYLTKPVEKEILFRKMAEFGVNI